MSHAEPVNVVGAGPVGALLALTLARRGHAVRLFERRPDLRLHDAGAGRSINLAVSTRGLHALREVGLDEAVMAEAVPMRGRMIHPVSGALSFLRYGRDDTEFINSLSRGGLNKLLMTEAEATGRVRIHFQQRLTSVDLAARRATFRDEVTGQTHSLDTPVLFGSDGSSSALRSALVEQSSAQVSQEALDSGYKELTLPPAPGSGLGPGGLFHLEPHALHIWPRGSFMLIALANRDGSFTCTLFLAFEAAGDAPSFARLTDAAAVRDFFQRWFPDAAALIPALETAFLEAPLGHMATVRAWPWAHREALVLGDAAHGIVPFFGQGMNAGFEDCTVLAGLLDEAGRGAPDWQAVFAAFEQRRKPDADAIATLAQENYREMRDLVADPRFLLHRAVEAELQRRYPADYRSRYQLVTFTRVPYRVALEAGKLQTAILDEVTEGLTRVEEVDYSRAHALVCARLLPLLREHGL